MADKKSAQNPHQWPNGSWHSIPWAKQIERLQAEAAKGVKAQGTGAQIMASGDAYYKAMGIPNPSPSQPPVPDANAGVLPQPFDPNLAAQTLGANWNIQTSDAEAAYQRGQTAYGTGYDANGARNTANPYSQAQLLEDTWRRSVTGSNNSMAAAGQYFSGARLNAQARNDREYAQGSDQLKRSAMDTYHGIGVGQLGTYASNSLGTNGASYDALRKSTYGG